MLACGKSSVKKYLPLTAYPRAIYIENQVDKVQTEGKIAEKKNIYVDVSTRDGMKKSGKLIEISKESVRLTEGYYYATDKNNKALIKLDKDEVIIPKTEILILKIW